jgi:formylglycine-generating enzyme required for sulfatase activity
VAVRRPTSLSALRSALRRLDFLPAAVALGGGVGLGVLVWALLAGKALVAVQVPGWIVLLGVAWWLAASAEPVALEVAPASRRLTRKQKAWARKRPELAHRLELVPLRGGVFRMGSPETEEGRYPSEGPVHSVRVSPFSCQRFLVTRHIYAAVMGRDPGQPKGPADARPVNNVSWFDAVRFCNRLSELEDLAPCYVLGKNEAVIWRREATGYRLPTEAEWEYACRAGTSTRWSFGEDESELGRYAWYGANSESDSHPVGEKEPNPWGLYDIHGNVYEWCWDWFGPYPQETTEDPLGPAEGEGRVLRGGSFDFSPGNLRSAIRGWGQPEDRGGVIGFRCVQSAPRQP